MRLLAIIALAACATTAYAKDAEGPSSQGRVPAPAAAPTSATITGSVGPGTYNRIFTSDVDNGCNATSTLSASGVGVPYAAIEFHTESVGGEPLVASINAAGTDIDDTTLSVYCTFNPADATTGLVVYNDDFSGLLSGFDGTEGATILPGVTYTMVVSTFDPASVGGGNFQIDFGGQLVLGPPAPPVSAVSVPSTNLIGNGALLAAIGLLAGLVLLRRRGG